MSSLAFRVNSTHPCEILQPTQPTTGCLQESRSRHASSADRGLLILRADAAFCYKKQNFLFLSALPFINSMPRALCSHPVCWWTVLPILACYFHRPYLALSSAPSLETTAQVGIIKSTRTGKPRVASSVTQATRCRSCKDCQEPSSRRQVRLPVSRGFDDE